MHLRNLLEKLDHEEMKISQSLRDAATDAIKATHRKYIKDSVE